MLKILASSASILTSFAPLDDISIIEKTSSALPITSVSYSMMWLNYTLWACYGFLIGDFSAVAMTNIWGALIATYYCHKVYHYVKRNEKQTVLPKLLSICRFLQSLIFLHRFL